MNQVNKKLDRQIIDDMDVGSDSEIKADDVELEL